VFLELGLIGALRRFGGGPHSFQFSRAAAPLCRFYKMFADGSPMPTSALLAAENPPPDQTAQVSFKKVARIVLRNVCGYAGFLILINNKKLSRRRHLCECLCNMHIFTYKAKILR
jgi:hypothetical protein